MKYSIVLIWVCLLIGGCQHKTQEDVRLVIGKGQMPNVTKDSEGILHVVYGTGDSIMYLSSTDHGASFSQAGLLAVLPGLTAADMRGPQIAATDSGIAVIACNQQGNIFCFRRSVSGTWSRPVKVNDADSAARENFTALSGDGNNMYAVWLDLRDKHNKIFGARSADGGVTWSKNREIYASPDSTVCQCCKPSVQVKGDHVYVMFRNWLHGNRDMYLIQSVDAGASFAPAQQLGNESWALNGCPMDGGGLAIDDKGGAETVWNRKGVIYSAEPGKPEQALGEGKACTIASVNGKNVYAWVENDQIVVLNSKGVKRTIGTGQLPVIKPLDSKRMVCVWENKKEIYSTVFDL